MSAISLKSITGITSITTPAGVDNQLTLHNNNTSEAVKIDVAGNVHINNHLSVAGVSTFSHNVKFVGTTSGRDLNWNYGSNKLNLADNVLLGFGNSDDLLIHHTGSTGYIKGQNGNLYIQSDQVVVIGNQSSSSAGLKFTNGAAAELFYNGNTKFQTTNTGVNVTGNITATGDLTIPDKIIHTGDTNTAIRFPTDDNISFEAGATGEVARFLPTNASSGGPRMGLGTNNPTGMLHIYGANPPFRIQNSNDSANLQIGMWDASNVMFQVSHRPFKLATETSHPIVFHTGGLNNERLRITSSGSVGINTTSPNRRFTLYQDATTRMNLKSLANSTVGIEFGDPDDENIGYIVYDNTDNSMVFGANAGERVRIESGGRVFIGNNQDSSPYSWNLGLQVTGTSTNAGLSIRRDQSGSGGALLMFVKTGGAKNGNTAPSDNDQIGGIYFNAADGTDVNNVAARISGTVDGATGSNDTPGRLTFSTTADGANSPTERLRITSGGNVLINTTVTTEASADGNDLIIGSTSNTHAGMSIVGSTSGGIGNIFFTDGASYKNQGIIQYRHADNYMSFTTNQYERLRIKGDGKIKLATSNSSTDYLEYGSNPRLWLKCPNGINGLRIDASTTPLEIRNSDANGKSVSVGGAFDMSLSGDYSLSSSGYDSSPRIFLNATRHNGSTTVTSFQTCIQAVATSNTNNTGYLGLGASASPDDLVIKTDGKVLIGSINHNSVIGSGVGSQLQVEGNSYSTSSLALINNQSSTDPAFLVFGKSRAGSSGGATVVQNGDRLGGIRWCGADGSDLHSRAAQIDVYVDGDPGSNDMPGRMVIETTPDGSPTPTNHLILYGTSKEVRNAGHYVAQTSGSGTSSQQASFGATQSGMSASSYNYILSGSNDSGNKCVLFVNGSSRSTDGGANALTLRNDGGNLNLGNSGTNTTIYGTVTFPQSIGGQRTVFRYDNGGGVGAYLSLLNRGSNAANTATGIAFGCDTSDAQLDGSDTGNGQIKVRNDGSDGGIMSFHVHTGANFEAMKIVGNLNSTRNATNGNSAAMKGGVAFSTAGIAIDKSWDNYPGLHVFNTTGHSDTNQGQFRFHGWNTSYNSYPQSSGSDFSVNLVCDGTGLTSDERRKTGISTITNALNTVSQLRGVKYTQVNRELEPQTHMTMDNGQKLGFIAQEVIPHLPSIVIDSGDHVQPMENGYCDRYMIDYGSVVALLTEAVKELKSKNEALEARIAALESS